MTTIIEQTLEQITTTDALQRKRYIFNTKRQSYSAPYSQSIDFPKVPVIHPYDPNGEDGRVFYDAGIPSFPVVIKFPGPAINNFSNNKKLLELLAQYSINIEDLEVFFCIQNMPWLNESIKFRPHVWLDNGDNNQHYNIMFAVSNNIDDFKIIQDSITIHDGLFSPNNMALTNDLQDLQNTKNFYSFCFNPETKRAAVTLHWLLNCRDYNSFLAFADTYHNHLSLDNVITWSQSLPNTISVDILKALGNTEIICSESIQPAGSSVNVEIIDDEPEVVATVTNQRLSNIVINYNIFKEQIMPHITDSVTFELIVDPVFFPSLDETIYNRSTIISVIITERDLIAGRLRTLYGLEVSEEIIADRLNFESPATRIIVNANRMRDARLFIDVILIAIYYANNIDLNNININDNNLQEDLLAVINELISNNQRRQAAEEVLSNAIESDLRHTNSGLTNRQLELLHDWGIINTAPRVPPVADNVRNNNRVRPREHDGELPMTRRNLARAFPDIIPSSPNVFFQFSNVSNIRAPVPSEFERSLMLEEQAINNPRIAARVFGV